jgi:hypothetical protein
MLLKIILFVLLLTLVYKIFITYSELWHTKEYYRKMYELHAKYYYNLVNQLYDIERDENNQITTQTLKEPFRGYINENDIK